MPPAPARTAQSVALVTLGCARNEVDSEELAGRLTAAGWTVVDDPALADAVLVNTCGFVDVAKKDSIDALLGVAALKSEIGGPGVVVAVGCLSERYGRELAAELPEADAVLGFDDYPDIAERLKAIVAGDRPQAHQPKDRRTLLPISPVDRPAVAAAIPGHGENAPVAAPGWQPPILRRRLDSSPVAPVKLASGCDRRCTFCAIPTFRGSYISRPAADIIAEIKWLVDQGVQEVILVSENSTSYGKDLGDLRLMEGLLPAIGNETSLGRLQVAYLQPAEVRPGLIEAMANTPVVAPYFDLSFQHASSSLLRRMRRFGGSEDFLSLIERIRELSPEAGIRSNVIVGFPGETQAEFDELVDFLNRARLDAVGVFGYSDEEGTEAATFEGKLSSEVISGRVELISAIAEEVMAQRAEDRIGTTVQVLVEAIEIADDGEPTGRVTGRAGHQGPDDGATMIDVTSGDNVIQIGDFVDANVVDTEGVDLLAEPV
ncbi:MAG: 30S ribosomal protein S12 methylthiotransferase RimO [Actinomycetota bacterium]|nr:30S ribosomal protein S12 methylthiotransferase RimO [Actinomycetota bacterium]